MFKATSVDIRFYFFVPLSIFLFLYFYLSTPIYSSANVLVGAHSGERLFIDIGKGFNDRLFVPVKGGVATIDNTFVSIKNIKSVAVGSDLSSLKGVSWNADNFRKYTNNYLAYQIFLALLLSILVLSKSVKTHVLDALNSFDRQELLFFVLAVSLYSAACIIMFPFLSHDSFVPFSAVYGHPWDVFTGGFKVLFTLSYVCFGNPLVFLHILAVLAMSLLVASFFATLKVALNSVCAVYCTSIILLMPFLYVEVLVVERPFSSILAVSGFMLCFSSNICRRKIVDWRNCVALLFLFLAMLMRQDLVLYFFAAVFFLFVRDFLPVKALLLSLLLTCGFFASSNAVDFIVSSNGKEIAVRRFADSLSSVFGYMIKENKITSIELRELEPLFVDVSKCKAEWKVGPWDKNVEVCLSKSPNAFIEVFYPIAIRNIKENPFDYLKSRFDFLRSLYESVRPLQNYRGSVASFIYDGYVSSGFVREAQKASLFSSIESNSLQPIVIAYFTWNKMNMLIFAALLSFSVVIFLKRFSSFSVHCACYLAVALVGPCAKVLSTVLFAPHATFLYMLDSLIFVMLILPVLLISITRIDTSGEYKNANLA